MADDLLETLTRFHRDFVRPDLERLEKKVDRIDGLQSEMLSHFDGIYQRFDRLETEYQALRAAVGRIETRLETRP